MIIGKYNYGVKFSILPPRCLGWNWSSNAIIWNTFHANTQIEEIILVLYFNNTINFVSQVTGVPQFWRSSQYRNWGALFSSLCGVVWQHSINPRQCWPVLASAGQLHSIGTQISDTILLWISRNISAFIRRRGRAWNCAQHSTRTPHPPRVL